MRFDATNNYSRENNGTGLKPRSIALLRVICIFFVMFGSSCTSEKPTFQTDTESFTKEENERAFQYQIRDANSIFVGKVLEVGPPPGLRTSGFGPVYQYVDYSVEQWLKKESETPTKARVYHPTSYEIESPLHSLITPREGEPPELSSKVFKPGIYHIVFVQTHYGDVELSRLLGYGIRPFTSEMMAEIKDALEKSSAQQ